MHTLNKDQDPGLRSRSTERVCLWLVAQEGTENNKALSPHSICPLEYLDIFSDGVPGLKQRV